MQRELRLECLKVAATLTHTPEAAIKAAQAMLSFVESGQVSSSFALEIDPRPTGRSDSPSHGLPGEEPSPAP